MRIVLFIDPNRAKGEAAALAREVEAGLTAAGHEPRFLNPGLFKTGGRVPGELGAVFAGQPNQAAVEADSRLTLVKVAADAKAEAAVARILAQAEAPDTTERGTETSPEGAPTQVDESGSATHPPAQTSDQAADQPEADRIQAVAQAKAKDEAGEAGYWTKSGKPEVKGLEKLTGWDWDSGSRDKAFNLWAEAQKTESE